MSSIKAEQKRVSVLIPVFNSSGTLKTISEQVFSIHEREFPQLALEILFVDDGSTDNSWDLLQEIRSRSNGEVKLLKLSKNFGQLGALYAGFHHVTGDAVISISADLQDPVELMGQMIKLWLGGADLVICHRKERLDGFVNRFFSGIAYSIARLAQSDLPEGGFDYWLMSKRVCEIFCTFKGRHNFIQGSILSIGFSKAFIPYTRAKRVTGRSGYNLGKKVKIVVDFIVDSSYIPVRAMSFIGFLTAFSGVVYSLMIVYSWFMDKTPYNGWAPIMILILLVGGVIMTMLGVIGEYIWRIYDNTKERPFFVVEKRME